jgi:hypothetical protein
MKQRILVYPMLRGGWPGCTREYSRLLRVCGHCRAGIMEESPRQDGRLTIVRHLASSVSFLVANLSTEGTFAPWVTQLLRPSLGRKLRPIENPQAAANILTSRNYQQDQQPNLRMELPSIRNRSNRFVFSSSTRPKTMAWTSGRGVSLVSVLTKVQLGSTRKLGVQTRARLASLRRRSPRSCARSSAELRPSCCGSTPGARQLGQGGVFVAGRPLSRATVRVGRVRDRS